MYLEYIIPGLAVIITVIYFLEVHRKINYVKNMKKIVEVIRLLNLYFKIDCLEYDDIYNIRLEKSNQEILIKLVYSKPDYEFIITNAKRWTVNSNPRQWTRKTKPIFVDKSKDFIGLENESFVTTKIVLIYPGVKHVIRYLNESDTVIIKNHVPVDGVHFVTYDDFSNFIKSI